MIFDVKYGCVMLFDVYEFNYNLLGWAWLRLELWFLITHDLSVIMS